MIGPVTSDNTKKYVVCIFLMWVVSAAGLQRNSQYSTACIWPLLYTMINVCRRNM